MEIMATHRYIETESHKRIKKTRRRIQRKGYSNTRPAKLNGIGQVDLCFINEIKDDYYLIFRGKETSGWYVGFEKGKISEEGRKREYLKRIMQDEKYEHNTFAPLEKLALELIKHKERFLTDQNRVDNQEGTIPLIDKVYLSFYKKE